MHKIGQLASDWLNSSALANQRPADEFLCIIFPSHLRDPSVLTLLTQKVDCAMSIDM